MIRVHVAAEKSINSAMEDKNVGKNWRQSNGKTRSPGCKAEVAL